MLRYTILSLVGVIIALVMIFNSQSSADRDCTIVVLCAPSLAGPMEELKRAFNQSEFNSENVRVENTYRGSAELLAMYQISQIGDVLIAADVDYHDSFIAAGFCNATETLGSQFPCLIFNDVSEEEALSVLDGEASRITSSVAKVQHAAIGRRVASIIGVEKYESLIAQAKVSRETVSQVAADVSSGVVDVGIAWSTSPRQFGGLKSVVPSGWSDHPSQIGASVLINGTRPEAAQAFVDFLRCAEAQKVFAQHGFGRSKLTSEVDQGSPE